MTNKIYDALFCIGCSSFTSVNGRCCETQFKSLFFQAKKGKISPLKFCVLSGSGFQYKHYFLVRGVLFARVKLNYTGQV